MVSKIERLPLRDVWKHEAHNFTTWLEENIDVLSDELDINLSGVEREQSAGDFSVDLVAEDESGKSVIIENQLEKSDHDHLGKLITYLTVMGASTAIWIVANPRPEHVSAISWLNESSSASFYLFKVEAIRINDSDPAPLLTRIVGPSISARIVGTTKRELSERHHIRRNFWTELLTYAKTKTKLHSSISPSHDSWISAGSGIGGLGYNYVLFKDAMRVELYIDRGKDKEDENFVLFDKFYENKNVIETQFGDELIWQRLENKRACRICYNLDIGGWRNPETEWPKIIDKTVESMIKLENALGPFLKNSKV